jgi:hypothetical protein
MLADYTPSFLGLATTGILILLSIVLMIKDRKRIQEKEWISIILLLTIAVGIHSILHAYAEERLDWNPMEGKWVPKRQYV